jgi:hypothetical protein
MKEKNPNYLQPLPEFKAGRYPCTAHRAILGRLLSPRPRGVSF